MLILAGCGTPRLGAGDPAGEADLACLESVLATAPQLGWRGRGYARFVSPDADLEGSLSVRADPPARGWVRIRSGAVFGMVSDAVTAALPGDGHLVVYFQRADSLARLPWTDTVAARLLPSTGPGALWALAAGRIPWPGKAPPADLSRRVRVLERGGAGPRSRCRLRVDLDGGGGVYVLDIDSGRLRQLAWWCGGRPCLEVEYGDWDARGWPRRLRLRAGEPRVEATFEFDIREPVARWQDGAFDVYETGTDER